jgi:cellulose synthase/poly-beta-1,6-N-acetylglucosamine synthase-like glycosyltransferase
VLGDKLSLVEPMAVFLIILYGLVIPYIAVVATVIRGMFLPTKWVANNHTPSVSVIVAAHNEETCLPALLLSLERQVYSGKLEFIIVDDRSGDQTGSLVQEASRRDSRYRYLRLRQPDRRLSPKVNAVAAGLRAAQGEIIITTDADCVVPQHWIRTMVRHFEPDVSMVLGFVQSASYKEADTWARYFEAIDWFSLMLTMRSLLRFHLPLASTANNQAYRRSSFEEIGGFGSFGRAPSGDEDLLTQRLGRLQGMRVVIAEDPDSRVLTKSASSFKSLLQQRRRWVSRYHHPMHYHPGFLAGLILLAVQSTVLTGALAVIPFVPNAAPWVLPLWGLKLGVELFGINLGLIQMGRRDLAGLPTVLWAVLHTPFIATASVWSLIRPGDWQSGRARYRRRYLRRSVRSLRRRILASLQLI